MGYRHIQLDDITLVVWHFKPDEYLIEDDTYNPIPQDLLTEWHW
jgi:hypothetical protein